MYYQNYEDYMRSVLGYPIDNRYTYDNYMVQNERDYYNDRNSPTYEEMENMYPEIYRMINPLVCRECERHTGPITKEAVENMVDRIYSNIDINNEIMIKINVDNRSIEDKNAVSTREVDSRINKDKIQQNNFRTTNNEPQKVQENLRSAEVENRQRRPENPLLRDLIRILILNRLFGNIFPERPQRPPFPGPGRPPVRPPVRPPFPRPIQPRQIEYDDYFKF